MAKVPKATEAVKAVPRAAGPWMASATTEVARETVVPVVAKAATCLHSSPQRNEGVLEERTE